MLTDLRDVYRGTFADRQRNMGALGSLGDAYTSYTDYITAGSSAGFSSDTAQSVADQGTTLTASDLSASGSSSSALAASTPQLAAISDSSTSTATNSGSGTNLLTSLLTALGTSAASAANAVGQGAITTVALQQTNAQRLAQGLPPLTATGATMTAAQMAAAGYSSGQIAAVQSQLGISSSTLAILAALGVGAVLLLSGKRS